MLSCDAVTRCVHLSDSNLVWDIRPTLLGSPGFPTAIQVQVSDLGEDRWPLLEWHCSEMRNTGREWKATLPINSHEPQKQPGPVVQVQLLDDWLEFSQNLILLYDLKVLCSSKLQKVVALTKWIPDVLWWRGIQLQAKWLTRAQPNMNPCRIFNTAKSEAEVSSLYSLFDINTDYQLVSWTVR